MCTAITFGSPSEYFGRNLDFERAWGESVVITPRHFPFKYRFSNADKSHHAIIGMAAVIDGYPLYFDAINEYGLYIAGLNFVGNAVYHSVIPSADNVAQFELIPYILGRVKNISEAKMLLNSINITDTKFRDDLPLAELHWLMADKEAAITVEPMESGLNIIENQIGVLTNNPPFDFHIQNLIQYLNLTSKEAYNRFSQKITLDTFSRGMGAIGLPGDLSSASRFVRCTFTKLNAVIPKDKRNAIGQFFHILGSVEQVEGCVQVGKSFERTQYMSCCDVKALTYYYKTYHNSQITGVTLHPEYLDEASLSIFPLINSEQIRFEN